MSSTINIRYGSGTDGELEYQFHEERLLPCEGILFAAELASQLEKIYERVRGHQVTLILHISGPLASKLGGPDGFREIAKQMHSLPPA